MFSWLNDLNWLPPPNPINPNVFNPVKWITHKFVDKVTKIGSIADKSLDVIDHSIGAVSATAEDLETILSGRSNILLYAGIGLAAIIIIPIVLNKAL